MDFVVRPSREGRQWRDWRGAAAFIEIWRKAATEKAPMGTLGERIDGSERLFGPFQAVNTPVWTAGRSLTPRGGYTPVTQLRPKRANGGLFPAVWWFGEPRAI